MSCHKVDGVVGFAVVCLVQVSIARHAGGKPTLEACSTSSSTAVSTVGLNSVMCLMTVIMYLTVLC
jgi:hypothetical protein